MTWIITKFRLGFLSTLFKVQNHRTIFDRIVSRGSGASNNTIFLSEIIISNSRWHCQKSRTTENLFWLLVSKLQNKLQDILISTCCNLSTWSGLMKLWHVIMKLWCIKIRNSGIPVARLRTRNIIVNQYHKWFCICLFSNLYICYIFPIQDYKIKILPKYEMENNIIIYDGSLNN